MSKFGPKAHLASAVINWGSYYAEGHQRCPGGHLETGGVWLGVKEGAIDVVSIADRVPAETKAKIDTIKAGLKDGSYEDLKGPIKAQDSSDGGAEMWWLTINFAGPPRLRSRGRRVDPVQQIRFKQESEHGNGICRQIDPRQLPALLQAMPSAELHMHIEGLPRA